MEKQGNIRISSENMMPIIKKWLYSEKDIFLREIVANAADAITKYKKLCDLGETSAQEEEYKIVVTADDKAKTLTVEDNGIGMSAEEVEKYITQIAFSGAADFVSKYEKAGGDGIIGHFGLGFYSAYMVSENIEIFTKSYREGEPAVHWESDGNSTYTIGECDKTSRGTKIVMHLAEGEEEFLQEHTLRELIRKYCSFMPYNIYLNPKGEEDKPLNTTTPLYAKDPKECTDEEYKTFYRETFSDFNEPLFWIHLNMDYPFRLKGILYFPKVKKQVELERGQVKLYCNQVFIADNIKEVIPEFLMLLNGVIDCPDIPLNVSRSFLQNDRQVQKIAKHITKKVADKLCELFRDDRARYEACWNDISTFVKFGCLKDDDFYNRVKDIIIYKNISGEYRPVVSYFGEEVTAEEANAGKEAKAAYYVSDEAKQAQYIKMFRDEGLDAIVCDTYIDPHFISYIEYKNPTRVRFLRIDAEIDGALKEAGEEDKELEEIVSKALEGMGVKAKVKTEKLKNATVPAVVNVSEFMRRMSEMNRFYQMGEIPDEITLVVNTANPAVLALKGAGEEERKFAVAQIYYLAKLAYKQLSPEEVTAFTQNNVLMLEKYLKI